MYFSDEQQEETEAKATTNELITHAKIMSRRGEDFGFQEIDFNLNKDAKSEVSSEVFKYLKKKPLYDLCIKVHEREFCPHQEEMAIDVRETDRQIFVLNIEAMILYNVRFVNTLEEGINVRFGS